MIDKAVEVGDLKAVGQAVRISERRARLLGLDTPTKVEGGEVPISFTLDLGSKGHGRTEEDEVSLT